MTTIVRFTCNMSPWAKGQDAVLPDDVAQRLIASGEAEDPRPFPPPDVAPPADRTLQAQPRRAPQGKRYQTRQG